MDEDEVGYMSDTVIDTSLYCQGGCDQVLDKIALSGMHAIETA